MQDRRLESSTYKIRSKPSLEHSTLIHEIETMSNAKRLKMQLRCGVSSSIGLAIAMFLTLTMHALNATATNNSSAKQPIRFGIGSNQTHQIKLNMSHFVQSEPAKQIQLERTNNTSGRRDRTAFGEHTEDSILRPLLLKGLINARQKLTGHLATPKGETPVEEELVEQTIVVPLSSHQQQLSETSSVDAGSPIDEIKADKVTNPFNSVKLSTDAKIITATEDAKLPKLSLTDSDITPQPQESMRLTRTEIDGLLNDREGPAFYREREQGGQGVIIGEQKLGTASSDRLPGLSMSAFRPGGLPDHPDSYFTQNRLMNSATEELGASGFHHRFGHSGMGDHTGFYGHHDGRLMQSPAHTSEYNELGHMGAHSPEYGANYGHENSDYGPSSGMLRAGSGDYGPAGGFEGSTDGFNPTSGFSASGYPGSPMLDRHASELYGPSSSPEHYGGYNAFGSGYYGHGRLMSAGSHRPDEYSSRFGAIPFDQRGFANQARLMLQGNSMISNNIAQTGGRIVPLSPEIPTDELSSASAMRESPSDPAESRRPVSDQEQTDQVHEPIEDDPTATGEASGDGGQQNDQTSFDEHQQSTDGSKSDIQDHSNGYNRYMAPRNEGSEDQSGHSLVLNVPPPIAESRPTVEFSRTGSAGYLAPNSKSNLRGYNDRSKFVKKTSRQVGSEDNYDPANNPAHAGKYMID